MKTLSEQLVWLDNEIKIVREQIDMARYFAAAEKYRNCYVKKLEYLQAIRQTIDERIQDRAYQVDYEAERKAVLAEEDHEHE